VQFIAKEDSLSYAEVIAALRDAGVGSMPGTAAEVLMIGCGASSARELIQDLAGNCEYGASAGFADDQHNPSGHIETPEQQMRHLSELRSLQQTPSTANAQLGLRNSATICRSSPQTFAPP